MQFMNDWHRALMTHANTVLGHQAFIEFTLDENGLELVAGTPKSSTYFAAPWDGGPNTLADEALPTYLSSWDQIYHPDLVERVRDAIITPS